jgi:DNA replication protein DnaC
MSDKQRTYTALHIDADGTDREAFLKLKEIENSIESFVMNGNNLYLHSSQCGNGKTEWSLRLIQSYFNAIWHKCDLSCKALFINVPRFLLSLKDNISNHSDYIEHIKKNILDVDLVVWDELGIKNATQFEHEHLLNLINTRIDYNKSNIYTSNLCSDELRERLGDRLHSRIVNLSTDIELFGRDKRGSNT